MAISNIDWDKYFTSLDYKANVDADNFSKPGKGKLANMAMPSGKWIDIPLGNSGQEYTAPANGYYYVEKVAGAPNQYLNVTGAWLTDEQMSNFDNQYLKVWIPVKKGMRIAVWFNVSKNTRYFRFIYGEGEI